MLYVEFMTKFLLADSCYVMGIRLTSASWAQKRFIPIFLDMMYELRVRLISASWEKIFSGRFERTDGC